jgi:hypothetical protein
MSVVAAGRLVVWARCCRCLCCVDVVLLLLLAAIDEIVDIHLL